MRILFIGDVTGRTGRDALKKHLPGLRRSLKPDVVIVNGENATNGFGITAKVCKEFYDWGVDCITTGNHVWDQREIIAYIARDERLLRPANFPENTPGNGLYRHRLPDGRRIVIINMIGRLFMDPLDDPFRCIREILSKERMGQTADAIFVDFHAETTSEKMAFAHHIDGQVSAVIGTHTHVPTADAHVLAGGTAYQSDAGMTGAYDSVIGFDKEPATYRFVRKMPGERALPAKGEGTLCGCLVVTDDATGLARSIEPVRTGGVLKPTAGGDV